MTFWETCLLIGLVVYLAAAVGLAIFFLYDTWRNWNEAGML